MISTMSGHHQEGTHEHIYFRIQGFDMRAQIKMQKALAPSNILVNHHVGMPVSNLSEAMSLWEKP